MGSCQVYRRNNYFTRVWTNKINKLTRHEISEQSFAIDNANRQKGFEKGGGLDSKNKS